MGKYKNIFLIEYDNKKQLVINLKQYCIERGLNYNSVCNYKNIGYDNYKGYKITKVRNQYTYYDLLKFDKNE